MTANERIERAVKALDMDLTKSALMDTIEAVRLLVNATPTVAENATVPTVKESLTVGRMGPVDPAKEEAKLGINAPDPGPGWRLIDVDEDEPQEGDEMWMPGFLRWEKRWYPTVGFSPVCHYRRRVEVATKERETDPEPAKTEGKGVATKPALPPGLPPLPEGAVYLGVGGTFKVPKVGFRGWYWFVGDADWRQEHDEYFGTGTSAHFAAPCDSEVARLNGLGPTLEDEQDRLDNLAKRYNDLDEAAQLRKQVATLTEERDEIFGHLCKERREFRAEQQRLAKERDEAQRKLTVVDAAVAEYRKTLDTSNATIDTLTKERDEARESARIWESRYFGVKNAVQREINKTDHDGGHHQ